MMRALHSVVRLSRDLELAFETRTVLYRRGDEGRITHVFLPTAHHSAAYLVEFYEPPSALTLTDKELENG